MERKDRRVFLAQLAHLGCKARLGSRVGLDHKDHRA